MDIPFTIPMPDGMKWTPVLWDGEEDPDWHKTAGLDFEAE